MKKTMVNQIFPQRGVALITVMLVVALAAIIATQMTARLQLQLQRTTNIQFNQQAYWYAMGAEAFSKRILIADNEQDKDVTHLEQQWAQGYNSFPVDFGEISGGIFDLHACLNLNALRVDDANKNGDGNEEKSPARLTLERLITTLGVEGVSEFEAQYMTDALVDWLDQNDSINSAGGAEDNDYAGKEFPYFSANHYLASVNELRIVEHFTPVVINALKPHVCVIPESNSHQININTLNAEKPELLQALLDISASEAGEILEARDESGYENINDFYNSSEMAKLNLTDQQKQQFVVDSEYFTLQASTSFNDSYFNLNSTMKVINNTKIHVISRTIGRP